MKDIERLYLFIHPPAHHSYRELMKPDMLVEEKWKNFVVEKSQDEKTLICIIDESLRDKELVSLSQQCFGERCIVNPYDDSPDTILLISQDLERTFNVRGNHEEWLPYEMWSSNNARKWAEGLKKEMKERRCSFNPEQVEVESFGNWTGCYHKYSNFMGKYLGLSNPIKKHPEPEFSSLLHFPMEVQQFVEHIPLDHYVQLFLFKRKDGCPMAQFFDGLRGVWELPHIATVEINPQKIEMFTFPPNSFIKVNGASRILEDGFIADVGDGCHPAFTTIIGKEIDFDKFRSALAKAKISDLDNRCRIYYSVET